MLEHILIPLLLAAVAVNIITTFKAARTERRLERRVEAIDRWRSLRGKAAVGISPGKLPGEVAELTARVDELEKRLRVAS